MRRQQVQTATRSASRSRNASSLNPDRQAASRQWIQPSTSRETIPLEATPLETESQRFSPTDRDVSVGSDELFHVTALHERRSRNLSPSNSVSPPGRLSRMWARWNATSEPRLPYIGVNR